MTPSIAITYQEFDRWLLDQAKDLPTLRGDRNAQKQAAGEVGAGQQQQQLAQQAGAQAATYSGDLFGGALAVNRALTPWAYNQMTNPQGFGPATGQMIAQAGAGASGVAASQQEQARLRGAATGNIAGIGASQDAIAESASRGLTGAVTDINVQNQLLKNEQAMRGAGILQGIYGTDVSGALEAEQQRIAAVNAGTGAVGAQTAATGAYTEAGKSGWLQNVEGVVKTLSGLGRFGSGGSWQVGGAYG